MPPGWSKTSSPSAWVAVMISMQQQNCTSKLPWNSLETPLKLPRNSLAICLKYPWNQVKTPLKRPSIFKLNICLQITIKYTILFNPIVMIFHAAFPPLPDRSPPPWVPPLRGGPFPPLAEKWIGNPACISSISSIGPEEMPILVWGRRKRPPTKMGTT